MVTHADREIGEAPGGLGGAAGDVLGDAALTGEHPSEVQHDVARARRERALGSASATRSWKVVLPRSSTANRVSEAMS